MKIGLVCPYNMFRGGGVQEHVQAQADELRRRGHTVIIITPRPRGFKGKNPANTLFIGNSTSVKTPLATNLELGASFGNNTIDELLAVEKFNLLHVHEPEVPMLGSQIIAKAECPVVATFHAIHPDTPMARTIEAFRGPYSRSIFSRLAALTAVSVVAAEFVHEQTKKEVIIIPNGIDLNKYQPRAKHEVSRQKQILYIGRLEKRKGVRYLLKAYQELLERLPNLKPSLTIVGDGPERQNLENYVREHKLPRVTFAGFVSDARKLNLLGKADVFVSPALYGESFGIVLLEAMARGAVIVAGNNAGYQSLMQGTGRVSIVNPKDSEEFARRLELMLTNNALRKLWLQWASEYVQQFDYPRVVDQYEKLYKQVARKAKK